MNSKHLFTVALMGIALLALGCSKGEDTSSSQPATSTAAATPTAAPGAPAPSVALTEGKVAKGPDGNPP